MDEECDDELLEDYNDYSIDDVESFDSVGPSLMQGVHKKLLTIHCISIHLHELKLFFIVELKTTINLTILSTLHAARTLVNLSAK